MKERGACPRCGKDIVLGKQGNPFGHNCPHGMRCSPNLPSGKLTGAVRNLEPLCARCRRAWKPAEPVACREQQP